MNVGLLSSASALAVVGYTGAVIYHGHLVAMLNQLAQDRAFVAWMASAGILYYLGKQPEIGGPVRLITGVAVLAFLLKVAGHPGVTNTFAQFSAGNFTLAEAFETFSTQAGIALGLQSATKPLTATGAKT